MKTSLRAVVLLTSLVWLAAPLVAQPTAEPWRAGVATRKLTPAGPIWMSGYANRTAPSSGVDQDLFTKALALDDGRGWPHGDRHARPDRHSGVAAATRRTRMCDPV